MNIALFQVLAGGIELTPTEFVTTAILIIVFPVTLLLFVVRIFVKKKWLTYTLIVLSLINVVNLIYLQAKGEPKTQELTDYSYTVERNEKGDQ